MKKKQNILIVHNCYQIPGGEDIVVINEKKMLEQHGHIVTLYNRNNSEINTMGALQLFFLAFNTIFSLKTYRDIIKLIKEKDIHIVHVHNTLSLISPSVYYAARACKVPIFQTIHNFRLLCPGATFYRDNHICEDCLKKGLICAVKNNCYRNNKIQTLVCVINSKVHRITGIYSEINYICLTEFNKRQLLRLMQIKKEKVYVKPNFVNSNGIYYEVRKNHYIFAGRLDKLKGVDIMLESWRLMGDKAPKLIICGKGPMEKWCQSYIQTNNINVQMLGYLPNLETRKLISESKALIFPTQWYEGFPMSIIEAFSVGTPVVCSDLGNAGDLIDEGINGVKFKYNSPDELVLAVRRLANYENIYTTTLNVYQKYYTENINYEKLLNIYNSIS